MPSEFNEIEEIVENAENEWDLANEKKSIKQWESAEKLFLLAIEKAGQPLPYVHARLAWLYININLASLNDSDSELINQSRRSAEKHADISLKQDPENLTAQFVKTWVQESIIMDEGKLFNSGDFKREVEKLITLFQKLLNEKKIGAEKILFWGNKLIGIAEFSKEQKLFGKKEIYSVISNIIFDALNYDDVDPATIDALQKDIRSMKYKAESRLL